MAGADLSLATVAIGQMLESYIFKDRTSKIGLGLTPPARVGLIVLVVRYPLGGGLEGFLISFEGEGWFGTRSYKVNQGRLVRRLTMMGVLLVVGSGVWTMVEHKSLSGDWRVRLPFTDSLLEPDMRLVATLLPD